MKLVPVLIMFVVVSCGSRPYEHTDEILTDKECDDSQDISSGTKKTYDLGIIQRLANEGDAESVIPEDIVSNLFPDVYLPDLRVASKLATYNSDISIYILISSHTMKYLATFDKAGAKCIDFVHVYEDGIKGVDYNFHKGTNMLLLEMISTYQKEKSRTLYVVNAQGEIRAINLGTDFAAVPFSDNNELLEPYGFFQNKWLLFVEPIDIRGGLRLYDIESNKYVGYYSVALEEYDLNRDSISVSVLGDYIGDSILPSGQPLGKLKTTKMVLLKNGNIIRRSSNDLFLMY